MFHRFRKHVRGNHFHIINISAILYKCNFLRQMLDTNRCILTHLTKNTDVGGNILEQKIEVLKYNFSVLKGNMTKKQTLWPWLAGLIQEKCFHCSAVHAGTSERNPILNRFLNFFMLKSREIGCPLSSELVYIISVCYRLKL